jgi:hypothetical protein
MMAAFLAGRALRRALVIKKMKKLGATSQETAKWPSELGYSAKELRFLKRWVKETPDGRFFIECKNGKHC